MNFQGKAVLVYLEEDNIARAYFRVQPLLTQDGALGTMTADFPDDGFLRIVPDKNEQHTFKERMRTLAGLCLVDLRFFPMESNKIRTNKNYSPSRGETNQFIVYSDAVRALPDDLVYQVVAEGDVRNAMTPWVFIRNGANIQGPFRKDDMQCAERTEKLPPDSAQLHSITLHDQDLLFYWPKPAQTESPAQAKEPAAEKATTPVPEVKQQPALVKPEQPEKTEKPELPVKPEQPAKAEQPAKPEPQQNAFEQIQSMNGQLSERANRLKPTDSIQPVAFSSEQPAKPLTGTKLYQTPQRQLSPRRAHNPLMEAVENQRYSSRFDVSRYEAPGATIPQNTELKEVTNPADTFKRALVGMCHSPEAQRQVVDMVLAQSGMKPILAKALGRETNDLNIAAMHAQLQELEAERLMTLMQLDDAKKNLAKAHEDALGNLNLAEQKKLDQLHIAQQTAQNTLDKLTKALEPMEEKRREALKEIEVMEAVQDYRLLVSPTGKDASRDELISRVERTFKAAGFVMEEGDALTLLTAFAMSRGLFEICSDTKPDAQFAMEALAKALGAPLVESDWDESLVMAPCGDTPVLVEYNETRHPLICSVMIDEIGSREAPDGWHMPYASVCVPVNQEALVQSAPACEPATLESIRRAFSHEAALSNETAAAISSLRKGMREADAAMPLAALDLICRFVSATQNEFKGGVTEAIDRACCLYVLPHLRDIKADTESVKSLFTAMPRMLKALEAMKEA